MTKLEEETERLARATIDSNQIASQVGPQITNALKITSQSIDNLTSQITRINERNEVITKAIALITFLQVLLVGGQLFLAYRSYASERTFSRDQIKLAQDQQKKDDANFKRLNRPKLINPNQTLIGDVKYGYLSLVNFGSLRTHKVIVAWKMIQIGESEIVEAYPKNQKYEGLVFENIQPTASNNVFFSSEFDHRALNVFLCVVYAYRGPGMSGPQFVSDYYLWNAVQEPRMWVLTPIVGNDHLKIIKTELSQLETNVRQQINTP